MHTDPMKTFKVATLGAVAALMFGSMATVAYADDYSYLKKQELQQTVLRVQMPTTLGAWDQYYYNAETGPQFTKATVCWGAKGPITLPKAKIVGSVNYQVDANTNGSVSIYQYANKSAADAALKALQSAACTDTPKVGTESETLVTGSQSYDQLDSAFSGLGSALTYVDGDMRGYVSTQSTQRGLAIVQTQVRQFAPMPQTNDQQQRATDRVGNVNNRWHERVVKAYESFGQGTAQ